jgi:signal transduction histidine kinase
VTRRVPGVLTDLILAVICALAMIVELRLTDGPRTNVTPLAVVTIVIAVLPLLVHRRSPGWALVAAMATLYLVMTVSAIHQTVPLPSMITGFFLATLVDRRRAILVGIALAPFVLLALVLFSDDGLLTLETAKNLGFIALPVSLGIAVRERRASVAALVERAESAERTREEEALRRVSEERLRIARDVHDVVAHAIVAINVQAGVAAHLLDRDREQARRTLLDIKRVSGEALGGLRSTLGVLRDADGHDALQAPVTPTSGVGDLRELRKSLSGSGVDVALDIDPSIEELPAMVGTTSYRIVQEALTNVLRHAPSSAARVSVRREGDTVLIEVTDDGAGARTPTVAPGTGNGVRGMQERASALGGDLVAGPREGGGWRVLATLPAGHRT